MKIMIYSANHQTQGGQDMVESHLQALETKHAGLERRIAEEASRPFPDQSLISLLKKQKLRLKEELVHA
jgi:hypothetical protein